MQEQKTETGIDVSNYIVEKASGQVAITKPVKASENYIYMKTNFVLSMNNGVAVATEGAPEIKNINRASLAALSAYINEQEAALISLRGQVSAILADMDALDLV